MARKAVPEKHPVEKTTSPAASAVHQPDHTQFQHLPNANNNKHGDMSANTNKFFDPTATEQTSFDELQMFFTSDLGSTWQPAETAVGSEAEGGGLPPWVPNFPSFGAVPADVDAQLDFWSSAFPFGQQE
jgi:hypothetical protein